MKKITVLLVALVLLFSLSSCSGNNKTTDTDASVQSSSNSVAQNADETTTSAPVSGVSGGTGSAFGSAIQACDNGMFEFLNAGEYQDYQDLFYNQNYSAYEGKTFTKEGILATIKDAYNNMTRYYVWGYADGTKCCCFQWEFVAPDGFVAPADGSSVTVTGTMAADDKALDGYWLSDCTVNVTGEYTAAQGVDYDLTCLSPTLAYVQLANMINYSDEFNGKTVRIYGRALNANSIQHPYYDEYWSIDFKWDGNTPVTGQPIVLDGTFTAENGGSYITAENIAVEAVAG